MVSTLLVVCNGPSLAEVDFSWFRNVDAIGMNGAYRKYPQIGWYPKFFCCFDYKVTDNHAAAWKSMIEDPHIPIERFFLTKRISGSSKLTVLSLNGGTGSFSDRFETFGCGGNTGVNACQVGVCLGYKRILIVGADCNYKDDIEGSAHVPGTTTMFIKEQPKKNPNYFWDDYQLAGDVYNIPRAQEFHVPAWKSFRRFADSKGVDVAMCTSSTLTCFRKSTLPEELEIIVSK